MIRAYLQDILWRRLVRGDGSGAAVFADLTCTPRDRTFYQLLWLLTECAGGVCLYRRKPWNVGFSSYRSMSPHGRLAHALPGLASSARLPADTSDKLFLYDRTEPEFLQRNWKKVIRIDTDISRPLDPNEAWSVLPYGLHPVKVRSGFVAQRDSLRREPKRARLLFSGNADRQSYSGPISRQLCSRLGMLSRPEIVDVLCSTLRDELYELRCEADWDAYWSSAELRRARRCLFARKGTFQISNERWLPALARSRFFLAPPGARMPLCHNVVEAMCAGCVPILNYGRWFKPQLEDGVNCLTFTDAADLVRTLQKALEMPDQEIARLRSGAIEYYDRYLSPDGFREEVLQRPADRIRLYVFSEEELDVLGRVDPTSMALAPYTSWRKAGRQIS